MPNWRRNCRRPRAFAFTLGSFWLRSEPADRPLHRIVIAFPGMICARPAAGAQRSEHRQREQAGGKHRNGSDTRPFSLNMRVSRVGSPEGTGVAASAPGMGYASPMSQGKPDAGENWSDPLAKNQKRLPLARKIVARQRARTERLTPSETERLRMIPRDPEIKNRGYD